MSCNMISKTPPFEVMHRLQSLTTEYLADVPTRTVTNQYTPISPVDNGVSLKHSPNHAVQVHAIRLAGTINTPSAGPIASETSQSLFPGLNDKQSYSPEDRMVRRSPNPLHLECPDVASLIHYKSKNNVRSPIDKMSILESAKAVVRELENPAERAMELLMSFSIVPALKMAVDMDVFQLLADHKQMTALKIAEGAKAEEEFVVRIMRVLASIDVISIIGPRLYAPGPVSQIFTHPPFAAGISAVHDQALRAASRLPEYIAAHSYRNPTDPIKGPYQFAMNSFETWFSWLATRPREAANFNTFMTGFRDSKPAWPTVFPIESIIFDGIPEGQNNEVTVVDVGGGFGHDLRLLADKCSRKPRHLICQDQASVTSTVPTELQSGIEFQVHDFFTEQPVRGARAYVLKHICHDWPHAQAVSILRNIKAAMKPGYSKILILDLVMPESKVPLAAAGLDVVMMAGFAGTEREGRLWKELVKEAGLRVQRVWQREGGDGLLEVTLDEAGVSND